MDKTISLFPEQKCSNISAPSDRTRVCIPFDKSSSSSASRSRKIMSRIRATTGARVSMTRKGRHTLQFLHPSFLWEQYRAIIFTFDCQNGNPNLNCLVKRQKRYCSESLSLAIPYTLWWQQWSACLLRFTKDVQAFTGREQLSSYQFVSIAVH